MWDCYPFDVLGGGEERKQCSQTWGLGTGVEEQGRTEDQNWRWYVGNRLQVGRGNGATPQLNSETITVLGIPGQKQRKKQKQNKSSFDGRSHCHASVSLFLTWPLLRR